jgi:demethylmenaquinone methyltransferase/2-methoxy-6-polyprenyl-1,4-benzoquinol methylase
MNAEEKSSAKVPAKAVLPDAASADSKKEQVAAMFDGIAGKYDFLNHLLSMGIDKGWRRKAIRKIGAKNPARILDVATGTGDMAIAAAKAIPGAVITGVDISEGMLEVGRKKLSGFEGRITLESGDSESLPFEDKAFDAVMCAYGVRNFEHLAEGLTEMHRVLKPGGTLAILEFSKPRSFPFSTVYNLYFKAVVPLVGRIFSKHSRAYSYLPESVAVFPEGKDFTTLLESCGYKNVVASPLTFGITTLYTAEGG